MLGFLPNYFSERFNLGVAGWLIPVFEKYQFDPNRGMVLLTLGVLADTLTLAEELKLRVALLPTWYDVDTFAELTRLKRELSRVGNGAGSHTRAFLKS